MMRHCFIYIATIKKTLKVFKEYINNPLSNVIDFISPIFFLKGHLLDGFKDVFYFKLSSLNYLQKGKSYFVKLCKITLSRNYILKQNYILIPQ